MTLDNIDITNLVWIDQFTYSPIAQETDRSITGGLIVQGGEKKYGRPITLSKSWLSKSTLASLKTLESEAKKTMTLVMDDASEYSVIFNRSAGAAITATPLFDHTNAPDDWQYSVTIKLFTVEPATTDNTTE